MRTALMALNAKRSLTPQAGEDYGFAEIDTVDSFVALSKKVEFAEGNSVELPDFGEPRTLVLKLR